MIKFQVPRKEPWQTRCLRRKSSNTNDKHKILENQRILLTDISVGEEDLTINYKTE